MSEHQDEHDQYGDRLLADDQEMTENKIEDVESDGMSHNTIPEIDDAQQQHSHHQEVERFVGLCNDMLNVNGFQETYYGDKKYIQNRMQFCNMMNGSSISCPIKASKIEDNVRGSAILDSIIPLTNFICSVLGTKRDLKRVTFNSKNDLRKVMSYGDSLMKMDGTIKKMSTKKLRRLSQKCVDIFHSSSLIGLVQYCLLNISYSYSSENDMVAANNCYQLIHDIGSVFADILHFSNYYFKMCHSLRYHNDIRSTNDDNNEGSTSITKEEDLNLSYFGMLLSKKSFHYMIYKFVPELCIISNGLLPHLSCIITKVQYENFLKPNIASSSLKRLFSTKEKNMIIYSDVRSFSLFYTAENAKGKILCNKNGDILSNNNVSAELSGYTSLASTMGMCGQCNINDSSLSVERENAFSSLLDRFNNKRPTSYIFTSPFAYHDSIDHNVNNQKNDSDLTSNTIEEDHESVNFIQSKNSVLKSLLESPFIDAKDAQNSIIKVETFDNSLSHHLLCALVHKMMESFLINDRFDYYFLAGKTMPTKVFNRLNSFINEFSCDKTPVIFEGEGFSNLQSFSSHLYDKAVEDDDNCFIGISWSIAPGIMSFVSDDIWNHVVDDLVFIMDDRNTGITGMVYEMLNSNEKERMFHITDGDKKSMVNKIAVEAYLTQCFGGMDGDEITYYLF